MYIKKFEEWGEEKKEIHSKEKNGFFPKIRHIYYAKLGVNIGFEADGKNNFLRPILILAKIGSLYWVAPLTSKYKKNIFHHELKSLYFENIKYSMVMLSQSKIIDKKRMEEDIGIVSKEEFKEIQKKMKKLYFPSF